MSTTKRLIAVLDTNIRHYTVVFWGSEIWLEIFAQNPGFTIVKLEKKINSEGKLW